MQYLQGSILVVDDNVVIRQIMKRALEQNQHCVTVAKNGIEALECMRQGGIDLVLLDVIMPEMNGFEVLEEMAKEPDLAAIPVVVISGDTQLDSAIRCIQLGAEDYLVKPPNQTLLRTRVNASLRKKFLHDQEQAHQREIKQMYEAVKAANVAKTEFIAMATHELRNPIAQIAITNSLFSRVGELNEKQEELLDAVNFSLERMQSLIVDLDGVSRLEMGKIRIEIAPLDLRELILKIVNSFENDLATRNHSIIVDMPDKLAYVQADRERMIQVLSNLVSNAIKYTPDGGKIFVSAVARPEDRSVEVAVRDTGLGIALEDQKQIFSKFFRSGDSKVRARPGTGLGLYIAKSLIEMQNGRIWFESNYGEGTAFYFSLPSVVNEVESEGALETVVA